MQHFETERLTIRPTNLNDAPFILELLNTPKWLQFIGNRNLHSVADAAKYIEVKMLPQLEKLGYSNNTIIRKLDGAKVGTCGLYNRNGIDGVDIGFAFLPKYEKQGYAFESTQKLIKIAKSQHGITKISAITLEKNTASKNLLLKLGLAFKKMITIPNDSETLILFELEKSG